MENSTWNGKVAIVTGGSSGIGKALASELVARGAKVLVTGRNQAKLDEFANGREAIEPLKADSADPDSARSIIDRALDRWGRLDFLVNNAGAGCPLTIEAYDHDRIAEMCAVNIIGPSLLVKEASAALRKTKGTVVNISTALSRNAAPMLAHYAATKAALEHLTRTWSIELASDGIRVNAIAPGPVKSGALTGMMGLSPDMARAVEETEATQVPLGRRGVATDLLSLTMYLGSSLNEWTTGQVLTVDGGWSLRS